ncbi:MAG: hypothetical protein H6Q17_1758 [Bacteroidetes bacterium]|nr:hypothetical protein [Bacteroidota bacterium]
MKSIAIWYKTQEGKTTKQQISLHFNLWKLPKSKNKFERFFDIGMQLEKASEIEEIKVYFPCKIVNKVEDLGKIISEDNKLLSAIFNEDLSTKTESNSNYIDVSWENVDKFSIYTLGQCNISSKKIDNDDGTIIVLKNFNTGQRDKIYIRIRIKDKAIAQFFHEEELSNAFIQNAFSKSETIDFRMNEIREIDPKILEEHIDTSCFFRIKKAHFFYMCSSKEENIFSNKELNNCRHLEKERWNNYINSVDIDSNSIVLAYHWKFVPKSDNDILTGFGLLIKSKFESISWKPMLKYFMWLILITVFLNFLSNFLYSLTQKANNKNSIEIPISFIPRNPNTKK